MGKHDTFTANVEPVRILSRDIFLVKVTWPGTPDKLKVYIVEVPRIPFWCSAVWCLLSILAAILNVKGNIITIDKEGHAKVLLRKFWLDRR